ncbi:AI-2E family transporter [Chryseolinea soli]|uniref:AI-2E family transporter n=1 Tax=Chryseolinea soli TaxID=2321403 RepID=A0A385SRR9_9BACT|nr:AI-2E family transporter [Chryseolinea soli]AYB32877.1 AI-2E family transporter [Chryseolinea soli]
MTSQTEPFYKKLSLNLISLALLGAALYIGQGILVPLFFAILLATLLLPVTNFLQRIRFPKVPAIILAIFISLALIAGIIYLLSTQVANFLEDSDAIKTRLNSLIHSLQGWINTTFHISTGKQNQYLKDTAENMKDSGAGIVGQTVVNITEALSYVVFLPVYTFLLLFYKDLIKRFIVSVFESTKEENVNEILHESRTIGQHYILGLLMDMTLVFALNSVGFLILGIKYPIFLALVGALLNLVPYIGMLVANVFCMLITLITSENLSDVVWVAVILAIVQFIDNNFMMPLIVGNRVRINALVTIVGVIIGGALCGISGMFLAIPGIAVLKVIFDRVESLKPWGMLLGDDTDNKESKIVAAVTGKTPKTPKAAKPSVPKASKD